jgi:hypothetical protein
MQSHSASKVLTHRRAFWGWRAVMGMKMNAIREKHLIYR